MQDSSESQRRSEYQKWDYITLEDFRSKSSWNWISYVWLWVLAVISVAVYGSDTFTAVNLLVFDNWSSQIKPAIPFDISKWIFAGCIIFSWVLLGYEWFRALRVMNRANVAESYLDPLAVVLQSMRLGGVGKGWRRFLVFTALTKSKKGADYVALFAYFQFKGAIRVLLAEGPRQAINAMTLYSVMVAQLIPGSGSKQSGSSLDQLWQNIQILYDDKKEQAIILSTMLFTLVIWIFSALCLLAACLLYIGFLWHYLPREDGTLSKYCRRKVNTRLERIINAKAKDDMAAEEARRRKAAEKAAGVSSDAYMPQPVRQPTLPMVNDPGAKLPDPPPSPFSSESVPPPYSALGAQQEDGRMPSLPQLSDEVQPPPRLFRSDSESTIASNVSYGAQPTLPQLHDASSQVALLQDEFSQYPQKRPQPPRMGSQSTVASNVSYGPRPPMPMPDGSVQLAPLQNNSSGAVPDRSLPLRMNSESTVASNVSYGPRPPLRPLPNGRRPVPGPSRMGSQSTVPSNITYGPPVQSPDECAPTAGSPFGRPAPPGRSYTQSLGLSNTSNASDMPLLDRRDTASSARNFSTRGPPPQPPGPTYEITAPRSTSVPPQQQQPQAPPLQSAPSGGYRPYSPANASWQQPRSDSRSGPAPGQGRNAAPYPPHDRMYNQY